MPYPWVLVNQWLIAGGGGRVVVLGAVTDWRHDVPTLAPPITLISPLSLPMVRRIVSIIPHITHPSTHPTPCQPSSGRCLSCPTLTPLSPIMMMLVVAGGCRVAVAFYVGGGDAASAGQEVRNHTLPMCCYNNLINCTTQKPIGQKPHSSDATAI